MKAFSVCLLWATALLLSSHAAPQQDRRTLRVSTSFGGRPSSNLASSSPDASREPKLITEPRPGQEFVLLSSNPRPGNTQRVQPNRLPAAPSSMVRVARVQEIPGAILEDGILVAPNQSSDFSLESFGNFGTRSGRVVAEEEPRNPVLVESRTNTDSGEPWRPLTLSDIVTGSVHRSDNALTINETLPEKTTKDESVEGSLGNQVETKPVEIEQFSLADVVPVSSSTDQAQPVQPESEGSKQASVTDVPAEELPSEKKTKSLKFEEEDALTEEEVHLIAAESAVSSRTVVKKGENGQDYEYEYIYYYEDDLENDTLSRPLSEPSLLPETKIESTTTPIPAPVEDVKTGTNDEVQSDIHSTKDDQPASDLNQELGFQADEITQVSSELPALQLVSEIEESDDAKLSNDVQESLLVIPLSDLAAVITQTESVAAPEIDSVTTETASIEDEALTTFVPVTEPSSTTTTTTTTTTAAPVTEPTTTSAPTRRGRPTSGSLRSRTRPTTVRTEKPEEQAKPTRAPIIRGKNRFSTPNLSRPTTEAPGSNNAINVVNRFRSPIRRTTTTTTTEKSAQENLKPIGQRRLTRPTLSFQKRTGVALPTEVETGSVEEAPQTVVQVAAVPFDAPSFTEETANVPVSLSNFELELRASGEEDTEDRLPQVTRFPPRNRPSFPIENDENDETVTERSGPKFVDSSSFRQKPTTDSAINQLGRLTVLSGPGIPIAVMAEPVTEEIQQSDDEQDDKEPTQQRTSPLDDFFALSRESQAAQKEEGPEEEIPIIEEVPLDHQEVPVTTEIVPVSQEEKILKDIVQIVTSALGEAEAKDTDDIEIAEVGGKPQVATAEVEDEPQVETVEEKAHEKATIVAAEPEITSVLHEDPIPFIPVASEEPQHVETQESLPQVTSAVSDLPKHTEAEEPVQQADLESTTPVSTSEEGKADDHVAPSHEEVATVVDIAEKQETPVVHPAIAVEHDTTQIDLPASGQDVVEPETSTDPVLPKEENDVPATTETITTTTTTTTEAPTTTTTTTAAPAKTTAFNRFRGGAASRFPASSSAFANKIRNRTREPASNSVTDTTTTAPTKRPSFRRTSSSPLFRKPANAEDSVTSDSGTADNTDSSSTPVRGNVRSRPQVPVIRGRFNLRRGNQNNETSDGQTSVEPTTAAPKRTTTKRPLVAPVSRTAPQRGRPNILQGRRGTTTVAPVVSEPAAAETAVVAEGEEPKTDTEEAADEKETSIKTVKEELSTEVQQPVTAAPSKLNRLKHRPVIVVSEKPKVSRSEVSLADRRNKLTSLRKKPVTEEGTEAPKVIPEDAGELNEGESNPVAVESSQQTGIETSEAPAPPTGRNAINRLRGNRVPGQLAPKRTRSGLSQ